MWNLPLNMESEKLMSSINFILDTGKRGWQTGKTQTKHKVAFFHQALHCFLGKKLSSGTEMHHFEENLKPHDLKYKMDKSILIVLQSTLFITTMFVPSHL